MIYANPNSQQAIQSRLFQLLDQYKIDIKDKDKVFFARLFTNISAIQSLFLSLYQQSPNAAEAFDGVLQSMVAAHADRANTLLQRDAEKLQKDHWFLSNNLMGMSLYVDQFCNDLQTMPTKIDYLKELGVNLLHLMPIFESPVNESDGGYAVSNFRKVDGRFGTIDDLKKLQQTMLKNGMYLMLDIVLNHTSHHHQWATKAKLGDEQYQKYYYMYSDRHLPDMFDQSMPDVFPESSPGSFTYVPECGKWVMSVFHNYQWDLNYSNPIVFKEMLGIIFYYANLGVDILRVDAPAFIWKQLGTTCQNLPEAHILLQLIKLCVQVATPGMAILGEAIVAPKEIMKYFGTGNNTAKECDFAYNATQMALQWDMLATADTRVMLIAQREISQKPYGTSWITYTRCHDDIGLGYDDYMIQQSGFNAYQHRQFLKNFYSGNHADSFAVGALFASNPKTGDARISGSLASLCGLEKALNDNNELATNTAIDRIILMQAHSFFIGGLPMLFYGDEVGYTNDYSYLTNPSKSYDNRWMHRPVINWDKNDKIHEPATIEHRIFSRTQKLIRLRKALPVIADKKNITWLVPHNIHVAGFIRAWDKNRVYCLFNFSNKEVFVTWYVFKEHGLIPTTLYDHWADNTYTVGSDNDYFVLQPYQFCILEVQ